MLDTTFIWFISAFLLSLFSLLAVRLLLTQQERHKDLKKRLQKLSQEIALGYFQHALKDLGKLPPSKLYCEEIDLLKIQCYRGLGRTKELEQFLDRALARAPTSLKLQLHQAQLYTDQRAYTKAIAIYETLPTHSLGKGFFSYCQALYKVERYDSCLEIAQNYTNKPSGKMFELLGHCHYCKGDYAHALDFYLKARNLNISSCEQMEKRGEALMTLKRYDEALENWYELISTDIHSDRALLGLSLCLQYQNRHKEALRIYEEAPKWLENSRQFQADLGRCYYQLRNYKKAVSHLLNAFEMGDSSPTVLMTCAAALEHQRLWSHARCLYDQLIEEQPMHYGGYAGIAYLFAIGKLDVPPSSQLITSSTEKTLGEASAKTHQLHAAESIHENLSDSLEHLPTAVDSADPPPHAKLQSLEDLSIQCGEIAVKHHPCLWTWELLSGAYARAGYFDKAHDIQESLTRHYSREHGLNRRQEAMRLLRKHKPLNKQHLPQLKIA